MEKFINKWNNKKPVHPKGISGQCVSLYRLYLDFLGAPQSPTVKGAKDIWTTYSREHFDRIQNTPERVPLEGDIIIWNAFKGNRWGHVGIFVEGGKESFKSFDANWPRPSFAHLQFHTYDDVLGWLRYKKNVIIGYMNLERINDALGLNKKANLDSVLRRIKENSKELDLVYKQRDTWLKKYEQEQHSHRETLEKLKAEYDKRTTCEAKLKHFSTSHNIIEKIKNLLHL